MQVHTLPGVLRTPKKKINCVQTEGGGEGFWKNIKTTIYLSKIRRLGSLAFDTNQYFLGIVKIYKYKKRLKHFAVQQPIILPVLPCLLCVHVCLAGEGRINVHSFGPFQA